MWNNLKAFFAAPYRGATEMNAGDWFLFVGFLLVVLTLWAMIFNHVKEGIE